MKELQHLNSMIKAEEKSLSVNIDYVIVYEGDISELISKILRIAAQLVYLALMMMISVSLRFQSNNVQRRLGVGKPYLN